MIEDEADLRLVPFFEIMAQHPPPIGEAIQLIDRGDGLQRFLKISFTQISPIGGRRVTRIQTNPYRGSSLGFRCRRVRVWDTWAEKCLAGVP